MITATLATACQKMHLYIFLNLVFYQLIIYTFQGHYEYSHSEITCKDKSLSHYCRPQVPFINIEDRPYLARTFREDNYETACVSLVSSC